jgi:hypothetical protein
MFADFQLHAENLIWYHVPSHHTLSLGPIHICNASLKFSIYSERLKTAKVKSHYGKDNIHDVLSYRPVSFVLKNHVNGGPEWVSGRRNQLQQQLSLLLKVYRRL